MDGNYRVVFSELLAKIDYSGQIVALLVRAFEYFKVRFPLLAHPKLLSRCAQTSRYLRYANTLAVYIATEQLETGNYALAKKCVQMAIT